MTQDTSLLCMYIDESFCGLLPGLAAIIQDSPEVVCSNSTNHNGTHRNSNAQTSSDDSLLYSGMTYYIILLVIMLLSDIAFLALNALPFAVREQSVRSVEVITNPVNQEPNDTTNIQQTSFLVMWMLM